VTPLGVQEQNKEVEEMGRVKWYPYRGQFSWNINFPDEASKEDLLFLDFL